MRIRTNGRDWKVTFGENHGKPPKAGNRGEIHGWTAQSVKAMTWWIGGTLEIWRYHLALTYWKDWPRSGKGLKSHLNRWLNCVRSYGISYVWALEFQKRQSPHFHVLLDCERMTQARRLAKRWLEISEPMRAEDPYRRRHGVHVSRISGDWIRPYLVGDFRKAIQKEVPEDLRPIGRLWGHSRGIKPRNLEFECDGLDPGELMAKFQDWARSKNVTLGDHKRLGVTMWDPDEDLEQWLTYITTSIRRTL